MPTVVEGKCSGCGLCLSVCQCHALRLTDNVISVVEMEDCDWCALCEAVCPTGAIACPFEIVSEEP